MTITMKNISVIALMFVSAALLGCNGSESKPDPAADGNAASHADDHDHDHADDHDHAGDHSVKGHAHGAGPHGGTIADWGGGKFHVEFTVDHDKQQATVYVLGGDEKTATPIDAESIELSIRDPDLQVTLAPEPQEGDPEGKSSRFVGTDEKFGIVKEYSGTMTALVEGTPYSGDFSEEAHADSHADGHDHADGTK